MIKGRQPVAAGTRLFLRARNSNEAGTDQYQHARCDVGRDADTKGLTPRRPVPVSRHGA